MENLQNLDHFPEAAASVQASAATAASQLSARQTKPQKKVPEITTGLRADVIRIPGAIYDCSGIRIHGRRVKSLIFTTDISIILNNNADAVLAVYPFTPHPAIVQAITSVAPMPVLAGVGGGTTQGSRCAQIAMLAEAQGCIGVVVNAPTPLTSIRMIRDVVDCPIVGTIVSGYQNITSRIEAGINILNVSGGKETSRIVRAIRKGHPDIPIIATGGPTEDSIREVIAAGANAITFTPPENGVLFRSKMDKYRQTAEDQFEDDHKLI